MRSLSTVSATERALLSFDDFLARWMPPAMQDYMFGPATSAADAVRLAIRGIADQTVLSLPQVPFGWAAFAGRPDNDREDGFSYEIGSAVFPTAEQAANAQLYLIEKRPERGVMYVVGEIRRLS